VLAWPLRIGRGKIVIPADAVDLLQSRRLALLFTLIAV
jgi:hypothetical protein